MALNHVTVQCSIRERAAWVRLVEAFREDIDVLFAEVERLTAEVERVAAPLRTELARAQERVVALEALSEEAEDNLAVLRAEIRRLRRPKPAKKARGR